MDASGLYTELYPALCRYLYRFTGDADAAADVAQEAFVRLLERSPRDQPRAWLYRVATNLAVETARTRGRRWRILQGAVGRAPHGDPAATPEALYEGKARRDQVREALLALSEKERMALLMREEGFAQREIAEAVGTTTKSVGTLVARALEKLAARLDLEKEAP